MAQKLSITKYKKIIMLSLILVAAIICVAATYITEYNINEVTREDVFPTDETKKGYTSEEDFLKNFTEFKIELTKVVDPYDETLGKHTFTVNTTAAETSTIKGDISVTIALGANWVKYISNTGKATVEIGEENETVEINGIDQTFPLDGNLLFVTNIEPTVYVLVEWSEKNNSHHYTYLEFDYSECK
jgi:hypothetical protein